MAPNTGRQFKAVFASAQDHLRSVFGMELTELPAKEKVTISQKRAAQRSGTQFAAVSSSKSYVLTSTLPIRYRQPAILPPAQIPSSSFEASYVGLTSFILALIYLSPGQTIAEARLEKHLKRMNADNYALGGEKTEKVLKRMEKELYIDKVRERDGGGEETVDYRVGQRGKVEIGERGVAGLVRKVYGKKDAEAEELDRRLVRSLGEMVVEKKRPVEVDGEGEEEATQVDGEGETQADAEPEPEVEQSRTGGRRKQAERRSSGGGKGRPKKNQVVEEEAEAEEEEEDDEGEEEDEDEDSD